MLITPCDLQLYKSLTYLIIYLFSYTITNWPNRKRLTASCRARQDLSNGVEKSKPEIDRFRTFVHGTLDIFQTFVHILVVMAFSKNLSRTFCSFQCSCNAMTYRINLDHIIFAYDTVSSFHSPNLRDRGIIFKFQCWVTQNKDPEAPQRLEELAFKISAVLTVNMVRHLFCYDYSGTTIIDYHFDELLWVRNHLITNYYYPPNFADALAPSLGPTVTQRIPRILALRVTLKIYKSGPKNVNYPPLEVDVNSGTVHWIVHYPDGIDNFICVKHSYFNCEKYYRL